MSWSGKAVWPDCEGGRSVPVDHDVMNQTGEADESTLARDLWPENKGRLLSDNGDALNLPKSRRLPREYDALCAWMCVDPCGVDTPATAWVQPEPGQEDERTEVTIRLQGFVENISFGMLGTWNGTPQGAPKAMQTLTLVSGGCSDAFSPQVEAVDNVLELMQKFLAREVVNSNGGGKIDIKRRVFHKVRPTEPPMRGYPVPFAEDPVGRARKIDHMWSIRHRIDAGSQDSSGRIRRENPVVIRTDFREAREE
ncbi:hypothetical protein TRAPUB_11062 [Trametes pubescens]|uniref:Uncharacterized protein n=1 Tax=Trametes pubescens TaxID=154538 RepID=A0A1M2VXU4_TRAPU|nr:hypothetical protein TRAPUB_11062 [Trametes pubescens]